MLGEGAGEKVGDGEGEELEWRLGGELKRVPSSNAVAAGGAGPSAKLRLYVSILRRSRTLRGESRSVAPGKEKSEAQ